MNGTPVWEVLASKAQREVRKAQQKLAEAQLRREQAVEREEKLDELLVEYSDRLARIQKPCPQHRRGGQLPQLYCSAADY